MEEPKEAFVVIENEAGPLPTSKNCKMHKQAMGYARMSRGTEESRDVRWQQRQLAMHESTY